MGVEEENKSDLQQQEEEKKTTNDHQKQEEKTESQDSKEEEVKPQEETPTTKNIDKIIGPIVPEERFPLVKEALPKSERCSDVSCDRDVVLARVDHDKKLALIKAWEDNEKTKADNKASNKLSSVESWENNMIAVFEAKMRKKEVKLEKMKAKYAEKMKNKEAQVHMDAEEKRAMVEARRGEQMLKVEEEAAKYRATGTTPPSKFLCCFLSNK